MDRRRFLTTAGAAVAAATVRDGRAQQPPPAKARFRTGLVAYSYRQALQAKTMLVSAVTLALTRALHPTTNSRRGTSPWLVSRRLANA